MDQVHPAIDDGDQPQRAVAGAAVRAAQAGQPMHHGTTRLAAAADRLRFVQGEAAAGMPRAFTVDPDQPEQQLQRPVALRRIEAVEQRVGATG